METIKRQCNLVMLPTDKEDRTLNQIYKFIAQPENAFDKRVFGELIITASPDKSKYQAQHLYFTSNEEIKEGDWFYSVKFNKIGKYSGHEFLTEWEAYKIIASTDTSIGLPQPSTAFIEKYISEYNKGNIIEKVMVEYDGDYDEYYGGYYGDTVKPKVSKDNTITISKVKDSWSRAEVIALIDEAYQLGYNSPHSEIPDLEEMNELNQWISENL